jgi:hypothetical protein
VREAAKIEWNDHSLMSSNFNRRFGDMPGLREICAKAVGRSQKIQRVSICEDLQQANCHYFQTSSPDMKLGFDVMTKKRAIALEES